MRFTENYRLRMPQGFEQYDIDDHNHNYRNIDETIGYVENLAGQTAEKVGALEVVVDLRVISDAIESADRAEVVSGDALEIADAAKIIVNTAVATANSALVIANAASGVNIVTGTYTGNGNSLREIAIGQRPRFVWVARNTTPSQGLNPQSVAAVAFWDSSMGSDPSDNSWVMHINDTGLNTNGVVYGYAVFR